MNKDEWKQAIDDALVCCQLGTADDFESPKHALAALERWHYDLGVSGLCEPEGGKMRYEWEDEISAELLAEMLESINCHPFLGRFLPDNISAIGIAFAETEQVEGALHIADEWKGNDLGQLDTLKDIY